MESIVLLLNSQAELYKFYFGICFFSVTSSLLIVVLI